MTFPITSSLVSGNLRVELWGSSVELAKCRHNYIVEGL